MAFAGVMLIAKYTKDGNGKTNDEAKETAKKDGKTEEQFEAERKLGVGAGIVMALISAITETMIFLVAKTAAEPSP